MPDPERIMYAMNWEDPRLELEALGIGADDRVLAIAGGGCTVLSLLARGPRSLDAVDLSRPQLRVLALKRALCALPAGEASALLGGEPMDGRERVRQIAALVDEEDRAWWAARAGLLRRGVISSGRAERFIGLLRRLVGALIHPRRRIEALFEQPSLDAQARFYHEQWNTPRWRMLFRLMHKRVIDRALDPSFYRYVDPSNLGEALRRRAERCLVELPARENYFLSRMLLDRYLPDPAGRPPYLTVEGVEGVRRHRDRLGLHHAALDEFTRRQPDGSFDKLYLSNIAEWLPDPALEQLLGEVVRVARNGARVCLRGLMVDRPLPARIAEQLVVDVPLSTALAARERAFINASFKVATVRK
jgi:S-adenosylmethionine-diacylglycerol 3-amino-3-carboxypropyl transferase